MTIPENEISNAIERLRIYYDTGITKSCDFREKQLRKLYDSLIIYKDSLEDALFKDLHKSKGESYMAETQFVLSEIKYCISNFRNWAKPRRVNHSLFSFPSKNKIIPEPYGVALIIAPWNYPVQLLIAPLIGAIAAGNCVVLKPSPYTKNVSRVLTEMIESCFDKDYIIIYQGDHMENQAILSNRFDYIFFTGGTEFGKYVAQCAANFLTPTTLELGGKSPCIVSKYADIDMSAKRIVWGKLLNAGQTCIAPDYIFAECSIKDKLIEKMIFYIESFFGKDQSLSDVYPRIISDKAIERILSLINSSGKVIYGGIIKSEEKYISPTIIENPDSESKIMKEEIFGPLLPVLDYNNIDEVIAYINKNEKPLALYFFGNENEAHKIIDNTSSGGVCVNDTIMHICNHNLPFGGIGGSGMGHYHGKYSFETFSHYKSVMYRYSFFDMNFRYAPYKIPDFVKKIL